MIEEINDKEDVLMVKNLRKTGFKYLLPRQYRIENNTIYELMPGGFFKLRSKEVFIMKKTTITPYIYHGD